ncbi:Uncharacterised protein [Kluyvera cryocrescens]|uniref:Uncharacterized protein n=1 Tax=Kluyvera cryocrescens TaxID=580 RepID=A0A485BH62_KLUCR|nr:Uncharacterised protein [Kluyvera cryocrescens]
MAQGCVVRQLLTSPGQSSFDGLHQTINVALEYDAIIYDGCNFIDNLWGSEAGIRN